MKFVKIVLIILNVICFSQGSIAQTSSIQGTVKDKRGPVPSAKIILKDTPYRTIGDLDGAFFIKNIPPGKYTLTIELTGFNPF